MRRRGGAPLAALLLLGLGCLRLITAAEGLRCFVCNSKADSRCADPMQAAEESSEPDEKEGDGSNRHEAQGQAQGQGQGEGLQMVDCKAAHSVRQAMDAVSGLLSRLGQRAPGGGDVWAAVRAAALASSSSGFSGAVPTGSSGPGQGGLLGQQGHGGHGGHGGYGGYGGYGRERGHDDQESTALCHKVDMEVDGETVTDRGCAPGRVLGQEPCEALAAALGDADFCELCEEDGCNAAPVATASATVSAAAVLGHGLRHLFWRRG